MNKFCLSEKHAERPTTRNPIYRRTVPEWRTNFSLPLLGNVRTNSPSRRIVSEDFQPSDGRRLISCYNDHGSERTSSTAYDSSRRKQKLPRICGAAKASRIAALFQQSTTSPRGRLGNDFWLKAEAIVPFPAL